MPGSNVQGEELEQYRKTWSSDVPVSRELRFQTESRRATNYVPEKFKVYTVRMLPGIIFAVIDIECIPYFDYVNGDIDPHLR
jgi:hypothetical protein